MTTFHMARELIRRRRAEIGRHPRRDARRGRGSGARDEGSALILTLVFVLVVSLMIVPVMNYIMAVTRSNRVLVERAERIEAVKGGLRVALVNPTQLYSACVASGRTVPVALAVPPGLGIKSQCTTTNDALQEVPSNLRYALTSIQAGSAAAIPPPYVSPDPSSPEMDGMISTDWCTSMNATPQVPCGRPYPGNGNTDIGAWLADATTTSNGERIFAPHLPSFTNSLRSPVALDLTTVETPCKVYFPGKYVDPVVITGSTPVYFVSGVYYFEHTVRISGDAKVVVGAGVEPGCADSDSQAVLETTGAPLDAYSNGVGGTFVFGAAGRLVVDTATASSGKGANLVFNRRLVPDTDPLVILNDISIMSVNGVWDGSSTSDLTVTDPTTLQPMLYVPASKVADPTPSDPWTHRYKASTLISATEAPVPCAPPPTAPAASCPILDLNFTTAAKVNVKIPGYVAVPQGSISVQTAPGAGVDKRVVFGGGILTAQMSVSADKPEFLQLGLLNPVVQKTFKITTETTGGSPHIVSVALVQVNETGGYAVNSWIVGSSA